MVCRYLVICCFEILVLVEVGCRVLVVFFVWRKVVVSGWWLLFMVG